jgi:sensor c-di-GMP phosphodiesterase-like protein
VYSNLSYQKRFSIDRIKIDRAFIREIGRDAEHEALTLAVIAIADALKFDVIAEGVEFEIQGQFLVAHGCPQGQGFPYSPAVTGDAFAEGLQPLSPAEVGG